MKPGLEPSEDEKKEAEEILLKKKEDMNFVKNYKSYIQELSDLEKQIKEEIINYKGKISKEGENTIGQEYQIKNKLLNFDEKLTKLQDAYSDKNAPSGIPERELDRRQKDLQKFRISYEEIRKQFSDLEKKKYSYKKKIVDNGEVEEDYNHREEFQNKGAQELLLDQKRKLEEQDQQIEDIVVDVKKNTVLAKHAGRVIKEQNKKLEEISEDIERTDDRMKTLTGRFKNYANRQSWCCLSFILVIELGIALAVYYFLYK